jgi:integrase
VNQILPFFGDTPLDKITDKDVNKWLMGFAERVVVKDGKKETMRYRNTYANSAFGTFGVMLGEAVRRGLIAANPCEKVKKLKNDRKEIKILTREEVQKLFPEDYKAVWGRNKIACVANRLASLTGMRIGEILGLRVEYVFDDYILVCGQYGANGYIPHTKTKEDREIMLIPEMIGELKNLMAPNGKGFVFSTNGGVKPVSKTNIRRTFRIALNKIGITKEEVVRRALTIHGWRHFVNTDLLSQGYSIAQVQAVTGHKSLKSTEGYNHLKAQQISDVLRAQAVIAGVPCTESEPPDNEPIDTTANTEGLQLVKKYNRRSA